VAGLALIEAEQQLLIAEVVVESVGIERASDPVPVEAGFKSTFVIEACLDAELVVVVFFRVGNIERRRNKGGDDTLAIAAGPLGVDQDIVDRGIIQIEQPCRGIGVFLENKVAGTVWNDVLHYL
jgi:hypothetical protein